MAARGKGGATKQNLRAARDVARAEIVAKVVQDAIWRFNDESEETLSVYDVMGVVVQDLIGEGLCPACLKGAIEDGFDRAGADGDTHVATDGEGALTRNEDGVYH